MKKMWIRDPIPTKENATLNTLIPPSEPKSLPRMVGIITKCPPSHQNPNIIIVKNRPYFVPSELSPSSASGKHIPIVI